MATFSRRWTRSNQRPCAAHRDFLHFSYRQGCSAASNVVLVILDRRCCGAVKVSVGVLSGSVCSMCWPGRTSMVSLSRMERYHGEEATERAWWCAVLV